jgi:hypothetical protein
MQFLKLLTLISLGTLISLPSYAQGVNPKLPSMNIGRLTGHFAVGGRFC